jgi:hypothetical protein
LSRTQRVLAGLALLLAVTAVAIAYARRPKLSRVQRGWAVASAKG